MRYLFTIKTKPEDNEKMFEQPSSPRKELEQLIAELKPELVLASTLRIKVFMLIDIDDPHVKLRKIIRVLSSIGKVNVEPVSTLDEFYKYLEEG